MSKKEQDRAAQHRRRTRLRRRWTPQEIIFLLDRAGEMSSEEIGRVLGRTKSAIDSRAADLGLIRREANPWKHLGATRSRIETAGADNLRLCKDDSARRILLGITEHGETGYEPLYGEGIPMGRKSVEIAPIPLRVPANIVLRKDRMPDTSAPARKPPAAVWEYEPRTRTELSRYERHLRISRRRSA